MEPRTRLIGSKHTSARAPAHLRTCSIEPFVVGRGPWFRRGRASVTMTSRVVWLLLPLVWGCDSPEHQLLFSLDGGGTGPAQGGTSHQGGTSSAQGSTSPGGGGSTATGGCPSGQCAQPTACQSDRDCVAQPQSVCVAHICTSCSALPTAAPQCSNGWQPRLWARNGCPTWQCSPPARCSGDTDCASGETCYQGVDCGEGIGFGGPGGPGSIHSPDGGPLICRGNLCGLPGCPDTARLDCMVVGCPNGFVCQSSCPPSICTCDPTAGQWLCEPGCGSSVCVPPT
jgi:hypothetical protein